MPAKIARIFFDGRTAEEYLKELSIDRKERGNERFLLTFMQFEGQIVYLKRIYDVLGIITRLKPRLSLDTVLMGVPYQGGYWEKIRIIPRFRDDNPEKTHRKTLKGLLSLYLNQ